MTWDKEDVDNTTADFSEGTLTDVEGVDDSLQLTQNVELVFDGVNDYALIPHSSELVNSSFKIITSFRCDGSDSGLNTIISKESDWKDREWIVWVDVGGEFFTPNSLIVRVTWDYSNFIIDERISDRSYCDNNWYKLELIVDYVSGSYNVLVDDVSKGSGSISNAPHNSNKDIALGASSEGTDRFLSGAVRTFQYLDLDDTPRGIWELNEGSGNTAYDSSGNGNDATIYGASWTTIYFTEGNRTSPQLDLSILGTYGDSLVEWTSTIPTGTYITLETRYSLDNGSTWSTWQAATSGNAIPGLTVGDDLSNGLLECRQELQTTDTSITPTLDSLSIYLADEGASSTITATDIICTFTTSNTFNVISHVKRNTQHTLDTSDNQNSKSNINKTIIGNYDISENTTKTKLTKASLINYSDYNDSINMNLKTNLLLTENINYSDLIINGGKTTFLLTGNITYNDITNNKTKNVILLTEDIIYNDLIINGGKTTFLLTENTNYNDIINNKTKNVILLTEDILYNDFIIDKGKATFILTENIKYNDFIINKLKTKFILTEDILYNDFIIDKGKTTFLLTGNIKYNDLINNRIENVILLAEDVLYTDLINNRTKNIISLSEDILYNDIIINKTRNNLLFFEKTYYNYAISNKLNAVKSLRNTMQLDDIDSKRFKIKETLIEETEHSEIIKALANISSIISEAIQYDDTTSILSNQISKFIKNYSTNDSIENQAKQLDELIKTFSTTSSFNLITQVMNLLKENYTITDQIENTIRSLESLKRIYKTDDIFEEKAEKNEILRDSIKYQDQYKRKIQTISSVINSYIVQSIFDYSMNYVLSLIENTQYSDNIKFHINRITHHIETYDIEDNLSNIGYLEAKYTDSHKILEIFKHSYAVISLLDEAIEYQDKFMRQINSSEILKEENIKYEDQFIKQSNILRLFKENYEMDTKFGCEFRAFFIGFIQTFTWSDIIFVKSECVGQINEHWKLSEYFSCPHIHDILNDYPTGSVITLKDKEQINPQIDDVYYPYNSHVVKRQPTDHSVELTDKREKTKYNKKQISNGKKLTEIVITKQ